MPPWVLKFLAYGALGIQIEVLFTGLYSLIHRHWKLTSKTYLSMYLVYGASGFLLQWLSQLLADVSLPVRATIYLLVIYGAEATFGIALSRATALLQKYFGGTGGGQIPWHYGLSAWTPMGLINLKYAPYWFVLALCFDWLSGILERVAITLTAVMVM
jgi:hypothetical protein